MVWGVVVKIRSLISFSPRSVTVFYVWTGLSYVPFEDGESLAWEPENSSLDFCSLRWRRPAGARWDFIPPLPPRGISFLITYGQKSLRFPFVPLVSLPQMAVLGSSILLRNDKPLRPRLAGISLSS